MLRFIITTLLFAAFAYAEAQTKTTEDLHKQNQEAFTLFFYQNTLRMFNQSEDKNFDELIKDIEKMKFVMVDKAKLGAQNYKALVNGYKSEAFEEIMSSRFDGKNFDVFMKEVNGKTKGMIITVNDAQTLYVLDIVGSVAINNVQKFVTSFDRNSEIAEKIKSFTNQK